MGNICRSPAAEGVFAEYVRRAGYQERFHIDSAGTLDYHSGSLADERMRQAASRRGYELLSRARQVNKSDLDEFCIVLAMDRTNLQELNQLAGGQRTHIQLFGSFLVPATSRTIPSVPDPYYGGMDGFEKVLDMLESGSPALLAHCLEQDPNRDKHRYEP